MDPNTLIPILIVIFFAIGLHEYAHCKVADMAGDPTPRIYGRVTLNLFKHFDPLGTIMIVVTAIAGYGIGWGKPAPINPAKMRNPRWDTFAAVAAGPLCNVIQAIVWGIIGRILIATGQLAFYDDGQPASIFLVELVGMGVLINLSLAFFNLFPVPPLDGHWLVGLLLPQPAQDKWFYYCRRFGWQLLLVLVIGGQLMPQFSVFRLAQPLIARLAAIILPQLFGGAQ